MTEREAKLVEAIIQLQNQLVEMTDKMNNLLTQNQSLTDQIIKLTELVDYFKQELFGPSSEKAKPRKNKGLAEDNNDFFEESEKTEEQTVEEKAASKRRKKEKGRKEKQMEKFVEKEIELFLNDETCKCPECEAKMREIGSVIVRSELVFRPASLYKITYKSHSYKCSCKEEIGEAPIIVKAPAPKLPLPGSIAGPTIIARAIYLKHVLMVPAYRQIQEWALYGLPVNRNTLINWINTPTNNWFDPIYKLLHADLMNRSVLNGDETWYQILKRPDGKPATSEARFWLIRTTPGDVHPIIYYHADLTRSGDVAKKIFHGFSGFLHCDGYQAYYSLPGVIVAACLAHARRKFKEVASPTGKGYAAKAVEYCDLIFKLEREFDNLGFDPMSKLEHRQRQVKPVMEEFFAWLKTVPTMNGKFEEAVNYALNHEEALMTFLKDGRLQAHNNAAEERIRPIALGRKNYLFSDTMEGAQANAKAMTIIESAKANGLDPYEYMVWIFEELPNLDFLIDPSLLEKFMPWSQEAQERCKTLS